MSAATIGRGGQARSLFEIATGAVRKVRRTGQPVRRNSHNAGEREGRFYRPLNPREIGPRLRAAEQYNRDHKAPGARNGPLGHIGLEVLRELYRIINYKDGRLEPSLDYLMGRLKRSRAAIVRGLAALRDHGFLEWIRRTEPTDNDGKGPQVRQISNAYRFALPKKAADLVRRLIGRAPKPVDDQHRREAEAGEVEAMITTLPVRQQMDLRFSDPALAGAMACLGEVFERQEREFTEQPESSQKNIKGE